MVDAYCEARQIQEECGDAAHQWTHDDTRPGGHQELKTNPLRRRAVRAQKRKEAKTDDGDDPSNDVHRPVFVYNLDSDTAEEREGSDDERRGEGLHAGPQRRCAKGRLKIDGEVIFTSHQKRRS